MMYVDLTCISKAKTYNNIVGAMTHSPVLLDYLADNPDIIIYLASLYVRVHPP